MPLHSSSKKVSALVNVKTHPEGRIFDGAGPDEGDGDSDNVDGQLELQELSDGVVHVAAPHNGLHDSEKKENFGYTPQFSDDVKLSSVRIMSDASLATSVPAIPMANPTSAFFSAGASLVPSPVTATTSLSNNKKIFYLILGSKISLGWFL